jgi:tRNA (adenine37-N6)-methyltransferase
MIQFQSIGMIKSPVTKMSQGNWGSVQSEIHLGKRYRTGLKGLEDFSHIIVVFYLDRATFKPSEHLLRHPRGQKEQPKIGVFAQRTKYRPNPIGISSVELISVENNVITVKGLDAMNDTPLLDLKPYMPIFDKIEKASLPEWSGKFNKGYF